MEAYCFKCKKKQEIQNPVTGLLKNGTPFVKGVCPVCGSPLSHFEKVVKSDQDSNRKNTPAVEEKAAATKENSIQSQTDELTETSGNNKSSENSNEKTEVSADQGKINKERKSLKKEKTVTVTGEKKTAKKVSGTVKKAKRIKESDLKAPSAKKTVAKREFSSNGQKLVIVESPAKAKTIGRYLGKGYVVRASIGHVRDLMKSKLSVDVDHNFEPTYRVPSDKKEIVKELTTLGQKASHIYLASDPDREGEAIAWHLVKACNFDEDRTDRVAFHEITKSAIETAFNHPGEINMDLVNAQQARRILDRLVGYNLSPLLWKKVQSRLSAGRVQSVAVRLIVDREREINKFVPQEYWTVTAELQPEKTETSFLSRLIKINGKEPALSSESDVNGYLEDLKNAAYIISSIKKGVRRRRPSAPFTTSTLEQEASKQLGFNTKKTMMLAQQLYEGIDLGEEGSVGLITYMRTDSTNISQQAQGEAQKYIKDRFGESFAPDVPPQYHTRTKGAQEAHEAIRPTGISRTPDKISEFLNRDQLKLYKLIWQRFVASQMSDAVYDTMTIDVSAKMKENYLFRSSGSTIRFQGFLILYEEAADEDASQDDMQNMRFPEGMTEGQKQKLLRLIPEQHFTQPPARYTEATLIRTMEENGIGRPSTYATILSTIQSHGYVYIEKKRLFPTETGITVNDLLVSNFPNIVTVDFTSQMESDLDDIAAGKDQWQDVVGEFYKTFEPDLEKAKTNMPVTKPAVEMVGRQCPVCGKELVFRHGRFGKFISCSGFPTCKYTEPYVEKIGVLCPEDGGDLIVRRSKSGKTFYGCSNYPKCQFVSWRRPVSQKCPVCGGLMVMMNKNKIQCTNCHEIVNYESGEDDKKDEIALNEAETSK